jgi:predicted secreted hydrolase
VINVNAFDCPIEEKVIFPPKDCILHSNFDIEWYYITGNLYNENINIGYQITTFINYETNEQYSDFALSFSDNVKSLSFSDNVKSLSFSDNVKSLSFSDNVIDNKHYWEGNVNIGLGYMELV